MNTDIRTVTTMGPVWQIGLEPHDQKRTFLLESWV